MTECTGQQVLFSIGKKRVTAVFDGGNLTSDSGVLFLSRIDERLRLSRRMTEVLSDRRQEGKVQHGLRDLLRQRVFQIGLGYEDVNDPNTLKFDPAFQTALDKVPRPDEALASQPTLSRQEENVSRRDLVRLSDLLLEPQMPRHLRVALSRGTSKNHVCTLGQRLRSRRPSGPSLQSRLLFLRQPQRSQRSPSSHRCLLSTPTTARAAQLFN